MKFRLYDNEAVDGKNTSGQKEKSKVIHCQNNRKLVETVENQLAQHTKI